jgi:hypothetical protein
MSRVMRVSCKVPASSYVLPSLGGSGGVVCPVLHAGKHPRAMRFDSYKAFEEAYFVPSNVISNGAAIVVGLEEDFVAVPFAVSDAVLIRKHYPAIVHSCSPTKRGQQVLIFFLRDPSTLATVINSARFLRYDALQLASLVEKHKQQPIVLPEFGEPDSWTIFWNRFNKRGAESFPSNVTDLRQLRPRIDARHLYLPINEDMLNCLLTDARVDPLNVSGLYVNGSTTFAYFALRNARGVSRKEGIAVLSAWVGALSYHTMHEYFHLIMVALGARTDPRIVVAGAYVSPPTAAKLAASEVLSGLGLDLVPVPMPMEVCNDNDDDDDDELNLLEPIPELTGREMM